MMLREKSSPWARIKYVYVLPLAAIAVAAFARPEISQELEKISSTKISEFAPIKEALFAESQIKKPDSVVTKTIVTKKSGNTALPDTLGIKSIANTGSTVSVDSVVVVGYGRAKMDKNSIFYSLLDSARQKDGVAIRGDNKALSEVLIIIEDKESTQKEMKELDPEKIESLSVLTNVEKLYGDKAKNGVILITLKKDKKETDEKK